MLNHLHIRADEITPIADPDTNGLLWVHPDAFGHAGAGLITKSGCRTCTPKPALEKSIRGNVLAQPNNLV
jgi:hypothetical protein